MESGGERIDGSLAHWNAARGFGFITPVTGGRDVFVHVSEFAPGARRPHVGDSLSFEVESTGGGGTKARVVRSSAAVISQRPVKRMSGRRSVLPYLAVAAFAALLVVTGWRGDLPLWVVILYAVLSAATILVYALDKAAAAKGGWRTTESTLLALGILGGWPGAIIGQQIFRHKTRKTQFQRAFWVTVFVNTAALIVLTWPGG